MLELADAIWKKLRPGRPLRVKHGAPFEHDVQMRVPDVRKAKERLGFEATTTLETVLDEVIPWVEEQVAAGRI